MDELSDEARVICTCRWFNRKPFVVNCFNAAILLNTFDIIDLVCSGGTPEVVVRRRTCWSLPAKCRGVSGSSSMTSVTSCVGC